MSQNKLYYPIQQIGISRSNGNKMLKLETECAREWYLEGKRCFDRYLKRERNVNNYGTPRFDFDYCKVPQICRNEYRYGFWDARTEYLANKYKPFLKEFYKLRKKYNIDISTDCDGEVYFNDFRISWW